MGSAVEGSEVEMVDFDDAVSVAPNWQLVWWRFKKQAWSCVEAIWRSWENRKKRKGSKGAGDHGTAP